MYIPGCRDGFGLGVGADLHGFSRYKVVGRTQEGDWSLAISPVRLEDEAEYQCQVLSWIVQPADYNLSRWEVRRASCQFGRGK